MSGQSETLQFTDEIHRRLKQKFGPARCPLNYSEPHELAIAVILSAQCTDERVNLTTPALFKRFPTPRDYYRAPVEEVEKLIYSTGFYRNKAKGIQGFCRMLIEEYDGTIPRDAKLVEKMPGVGRKTANVVVQELYRVHSGVVVDTHVIRLSKLFGLSDETDPAKIERDLIERVNKKHWIDWSLYNIFLGRYCCKARKRDCEICPLLEICPSAQLNADKPVTKKKTKKNAGKKTLKKTSKPGTKKARKKTAGNVSKKK